jgi:hypothetical protein
LEACPELGTPATPGRPCNVGLPDAAFRLVNGVGIATSRVFGAESSRPASLLCTLRTPQSPGEWQHSLPACLLALAVRDLHPLDSIKGFHRLIFDSSPSKLFPARSVAEAIRPQHEQYWPDRFPKLFLLLLDRALARQLLGKLPAAQEQLTAGMLAQTC